MTVKSDPVKDVSQAIDSGLRVVTEISRATGLSREIVLDALEQLQALSVVRMAPLQFCLPRDCHQCSLASRFCSSAP
ncbi:MAG: hypothetical protein FWG15_02325 [Propionibacteriaceae bacterium]|nr:hypothetical protein [Propionibacteriaceae bacterium]